MSVGPARQRCPTTSAGLPLASEARVRARRERELFRRVGGGDQRAREELTARYVPLARSLASRYRRSEESLDDLMQVASIGLIKAIDRFDPDREIAFSSFAVPTILGEIRRHFRDRTWSVRVPRALQELSMRVDRAVGDLTEQLGRQPSVAEIAAAMSVEQESVLEALQAGGAYRAVSFDAPSDDADTDGSTLAQWVGGVDDGYGLAEDRATLQRLLQVIDVREREVLRLRFEQDMTQAEIGAAVGVSQMQVSRIIRGALQRLRLVADHSSQPDTFERPAKARLV